LLEQVKSYNQNITDCSRKQQAKRQDRPTQIMYYSTFNLNILAKELVDMPTKFQHSSQRSKSHINHNNNPASTPIVHKHLKDSTRLTTLKMCLLQ